MAKCAKGIQNARSSKDQKVKHFPAREEKHAEQETLRHYTTAQAINGKVRTAVLSPCQAC